MNARTYRTIVRAYGFASKIAKSTTAAEVPNEMITGQNE